MLGIDLEVAAQRLPRVRAAEPVGPQGHERLGYPPGDLIGNRLHGVAHRHDGTVHGGQDPCQERLPPLFARVKPVPSFGSQGVHPQLLVRGGAPHVGRHIVILGQELLSSEGLLDHRTGAEQVGAVHLLPIRPLGQPVQPPEDAVSRPFGHRRHRVRLVVQREVVENVLALFVHPP